ncbi:T9SS type B sorting domain-containing protein [uncultured Lutibacter sp.]|uniref:Ig-like domain-containing protein n=1 Tax=uncultured Lutibacter sp. TaxID=437739 RepID=UPI0026359C55|nr:T9SS type B sorting domain-containing protein [uncultured Lutibacter sp.]
MTYLNCIPLIKDVKNIQFYFLLIFGFIISNNTLAQTGTAPEVTAQGDQIYCPQSQINIVTDFNITNGADEIEAIYVQISEGFIRGEDKLIFNNPSLHPNISASTFNSSTGKLVLKWIGTGGTNYADLIAATKDVVFENSNAQPSGTRTFSITIDEKNYLPSTGHYYEYVPSLGITWTSARDEAELKNYYGLKGYLATITSAEEAQLTGEQAAGAGWIGGSDAETENIWKWVTGPEAGKTFWFGLGNGTTVGTDIPFAFWNSSNNEPNQFGNEDYAHITAPNIGLRGSWNDLTNVGGSSGDYQPKGYIVEYGGLPGDPILKLSDYTKLTIPSIITSEGNEHCGEGSVELKASADLGDILWFDTETSTIPLATGTNFTTPKISTTKTYYALASANGCVTGKRTPVVATIKQIPTITAISNKSVCNSGSAELTAIASSGEINWYSSLTGGSSLKKGPSFSTPVLNTTTTYYVDATNNGCTTTSRTPITLTVIHINAPTTTLTTQSFCTSENAIISNLTITGNSIKWYDSSTSTFALNNNEPLKNNTSYFASQTVNGCESVNRLEIKVILYETPEPSNSIEKIGLCDSNLFGNDTDGIELFDLTQRVPSILNGKNASNFNIQYFSDAGLINEITNPTSYKNTTIGSAQTIYFKIENKGLIKCNATGSFEIEVYPLPVLKVTEVTLEQCDNDDNNDGFSVFNLNEANELISKNYQNEIFEFYKDSAYSDKIEDPKAYENPSVINSVVYVKIKTLNDCERFAKINLKVGATQIPSDFHLEYYLCEDQPSNNQDGRTIFNFSDTEQKLIDTKPVFSNQKVRITYFESLEDALSEINPIPDISNYKNTTPWQQKIYARIDSDDVNACLGLNHVATLFVEPLPIATPVTIDRQCDDDQDGLFPFNVSTIEERIRNGQTNITISYFNETGNPLPSPLPNPFLTKSQTITIKVENNTSTMIPACYDETTLQFIVDDAPEIYPVTIDALCDDGEDTTDGFSSFDTSTIETDLLGSQTNMHVLYFDAENNPLPSPLPNPFITKTQEVTVIIENPLNTQCSISTTLNFVVNPLPSFEVLSEQILCLNTPPTILEALNPKDIYTYEWFNSGGNIVGNQPTYATFDGGYFTVIATSNSGCQSLPKTIFVEKSDVANIDLNDLTIVDDSRNNTITINDSNLGDDDYEYSLNNEFGPFQNTPFFDNIPAGLHTLYVRDTDNCGTVALEVSIIGYPKFFTPNNDGVNDTWNIIGISSSFYPSSLLNIFDRFGKLIAQINPNNQGWDGLYNGQKLPSSDYWFTVELTDKTGKNRSKKGHFSLIRR